MKTTKVKQLEKRIRELSAAKRQAERREAAISKRVIYAIIGSETEDTKFKTQ